MNKFQILTLNYAEKAKAVLKAGYQIWLIILITTAVKQVLEYNLNIAQPY